LSWFFSFFNITLVMRNPKGISHWMKSPRNLFKQLKDCYQTKTNGEMMQHDFHFLTNIVIFNLKKKRSNIPFSCLFFTFVQNSKKKKTCCDRCIWMSSITLSHFERITFFFLCIMGTLNYFLRISYLVLWVMDWWQSQLGLVCIRRGGREYKMSKNECESFYNQIKMNHLT
jgi:hypothetical protein